MLEQFADYRLAVAALTFGATLLLTAPASALDARGEAAAVVTSFNAALTARSIDKALTYLATGGVQFNLRPSHAGLASPQAAPQALTSDLLAHWSMIGPVVFASTAAYSRTVEIVDSRVQDEIATVWTRTVTASSRAGQAEPRRDSFAEVYLLVRKDGKWLIGAIADGRKPNDVGIGGGKPAGQP